MSLNYGDTVQGTIRWYDALTGFGSIRLDNHPDYSFKFYVCNFEGADSYYPHLVTNIQINKGDKVVGLIDTDEDIVSSLGLIKLKKVG